MHRFSYDCSIKEEARVKALVWEKNEPAKVYFCMPARECRCVKTALKHDVISKDTMIIFVEREKADYNIIKTELQRLGFTKVIGYKGRLQEFDLKFLIALVNLEGKVKMPQLVDLAFIDLCGEWTDEVALWFQKNRTAFAKGGIVSVTTTANGRNRKQVINPYEELNPRECAEKWVKTYGVKAKPEYTGGKLIPHHDEFGEYPEEPTESFTADCWATLIHSDLFGIPTRNNNHYVQQLRYRSPGKRQNMAVTTFRV
jgi:hypothetical protein